MACDVSPEEHTYLERAAFQAAREVKREILLEKSVSGLDRTSVINFSQIFTIDKSRLTDLVSMLPRNYITKINASVRYIFDAEP